MENLFKPYVYKVTNLFTNQYYIGLKITPGEIGVDYFTSSTNKSFKDDFKKNPQNYKCEKLYEGSKEKAIELEGKLIKQNKDDPLILNKAFQENGKIHLCPSCHRGPETRRKLSEFHKGKHLSKETIEKMIKSRKGKPSWNKGIPCSEDVKQKISKKLKGYKHTEESKKKRSEALKGREFSDEWRQKLKDAWKKRKEENRIITEEGRKLKQQQTSERNKLCHWWTNGKENHFCPECPEGFYAGHTVNINK